LYRTERLSRLSRQTHRIGHDSSEPAATAVVLVLLGAFIALSAARGFSQTWVTAFASATGAISLMVFVIQHPAGREQAATQRKRDELLRAVPQAAESLILLEEAPEDVLHEVEEEQRTAHDRR
jgi:low affinity Fe/Cu permease